MHVPLRVLAIKVYLVVVSRHGLKNYGGNVCKIETNIVVDFIRPGTVKALSYV